jgi:hypothetical protein
MAPHGLFRSLAPGNNWQAREFLEKFGPLFDPLKSELPATGQIEINLSEFWTWHLRFRLVSQLWEARNDREGLIGAWKELGERTEESSSLTDLPLGGTHIGKQEYLEFPLPWAQANLGFAEWASQTPLSSLRKPAISLVHRELNQHFHNSRLLWVRGWEPSGEKFRLEHHPDSLWSMIWEFFAWDTAGVFWRRCSHCQQFFYPRRTDQFYCTSRQQGLASKRDYARRMRASEKTSKRRKR